jgi:glycosyltransferase involved in cell wall biosynthesis
MKMPKTIKLVIDGRDASLNRVGVAVYLSNLLRELESSIPNGWEVHLITQRDVTLEIGKRINVLPIAPKAADGRMAKLVWYTRLPVVLRNLRADFYFGPPILLPWSRKLPCPAICTVHDTASLKLRSSVGSFPKNLFTKLLVGRYLKAAAAVICISNFSKKEFTALYGGWFESKSHVVYHGMPNELDTENGVAQEPKASAVKYILTVGTVYPKKNIARLISAFGRIEDPDVHLYIAGAISQDSKQIISAAIRSKKSHKIKFLGSVDNAELARLYKNALVFAFPSLHEGFGIPILEAFKSGVPVVCSDNTSLPEIAGPRGAILFNPLDVSSITNALEVALYDKPLRQKLIENGIQRVKHFSWSRSAAEHWKIFKSIGHQK